MPLPTSSDVARPARAVLSHRVRNARERLGLDGHLTGLMLALTFGTGVVDSASYLGLHRVFTANMTGNVIYVGLAASGDHEVPLLRSALALIGFLLGAAAAGHFQRRGGTSGRIRSRAVAALAAVGAALGTLTVVVAIWPAPPSPGLDAATVLLGAAMGAQAAVARSLAVADLPTVVVTSTMAALMAEPWSGPNRSPRWARRLWAGILITLGALIGAVLCRIALWVPMVISSLVVAVVVAELERLRRTSLDT